jgi:hypothetical protein
VHGQHLANAGCQVRLLAFIRVFELFEQRFDRAMVLLE